jgi:hypothetical protein
VTATAAVASEQRIRELYARCKHLTLAAGAALVLDEPTALFEREAAELAEEARRAAAAADAYEPQLRACAEAASELHALLRRRDADVEAARLAHRRLRREVWKVIPCEYVPCCAGHGHE